MPVKNGRIIPAYAALSKIMSSNNVWRELRRMARHEKKGDKRRRLESERWRKRFQREASTFNAISTIWIITRSV